MRWLKRLNVGWPEGVVVLGPLLLFAPTLLSGRSLFWGTPALQFIPWRVYAWQQVLSGNLLPTWNALNGMGAPLLANYQLAWFYPPGWLLWPFAAFWGNEGLAWAHTLLAALHLAWAGIGMVRLLRHIGANEVGQVVAGVAFSLSGTLVARVGFFSMIWTAAWLPWLVLAASGIAQPGKKEGGRQWFLPQIAVVCGLMLLAGHAQFAWYSLLLAAAWVVVGALLRGGWRDVVRSSLQLLIAVMVGACLAAVQLLPTAEYLSLSQRASAYDYERAMTYSFWPWRLLTLLAPDWFGNPGRGDYWGYAAYWEDAIYVGMIPLLLAVGTLRVWTRKNNWPDAWRGVARFCWGTMIVTLLLALGKNTPVFPFLFRYVPTFDMFQAPARYLLGFVFALTVLAGLGAGNWRRPTGSWRKRLRLGLVTAVAMMVGAGLAWRLMPDIEVTFLYAAALAGFWATGALWLGLRTPLELTGRSVRFWQVGVVCWLLADLLVAGWWLNPDADVKLYAKRVASSEKAPVSGRVYLSLEDENELKFGRFLHFSDFRFREDPAAMRATLLPNLNLLEERASANNFDPLLPGRYVRWMNALEELSDAQRMRWLALMDVDWWERVDEQGQPVHWDWVEGASRFRWYACAQLVADEESAWQALQKRMAMDADRSCVVLEGSGDLPATQISDVEPNLEILKWLDKGDRLEIGVSVDRDGWFLLADSWYPYWCARVDGQPVTLWQGDYLFRVVFLAVGTHQLIFEYRPIWLWIGLAFSLGSVLALLLWPRLAK